MLESHHGIHSILYIRHFNPFIDQPTRWTKLKLLPFLPRLACELLACPPPDGLLYSQHFRAPFPIAAIYKRRPQCPRRIHTTPPDCLPFPTSSAYAPDSLRLRAEHNTQQSCRRGDQASGAAAAPIGRELEPCLFSREGRRDHKHTLPQMHISRCTPGLIFRAGCPRWRRGNLWRVSDRSAEAEPEFLRDRRMLPLEGLSPPSVVEPASAESATPTECAGGGRGSDGKKYDHKESYEPYHGKVPKKGQ